MAGEAQDIRTILAQVPPSLWPVELPAMLALPAGGTLVDRPSPVYRLRPVTPSPPVGLGRSSTRWVASPKSSRQPNC